VDQLVEGSDRDPKEPLRLKGGDLNDPVSGSRPAGWGSASNESDLRYFPTHLKSENIVELICLFHTC
jgi:hypothetical protein